jgi:hypothetical protein
MAERDLQHAIRLAVGGQPGVVLWRNHRGYDDRARVAYGLAPGAADLIGIVAPHGRVLALEVKSGRGRATAEQVAFLELVERMGGVGAVCWSVSDALEALQRARL